MNEETNLLNPSDSVNENAKAGYGAAINLWQYEGNTIWTKFAAMVYSNTILLATLGLVITSQRHNELCVFKYALCTLGILLCIAWTLLTIRSFDFYKYWILSARELEKQHLSPVETVSRGQSLADGELLTIDGEEHQLRWKWKHATIEKVSYCIISVFSIVYILAMLA